MNLSKEGTRKLTGNLVFGRGEEMNANGCLHMEQRGFRVLSIMSVSSVNHKAEMYTVINILMDTFPRFQNPQYGNLHDKSLCKCD
jgi:hypothetical protein